MAQRYSCDRCSHDRLIHLFDCRTCEAWDTPGTCACPGCKCTAYENWLELEDEHAAYMASSDLDDEEQPAEAP